MIACYYQLFDNHNQSEESTLLLSKETLCYMSVCTTHTEDMNYQRVAGFPSPLIITPGAILTTAECREPGSCPLSK